MQDFDLIENKFKEFEEKLNKLMKLEQEFNSLDTDGFETEAKSIRSKLKDPTYIEEVASEIAFLKKSISEREQRPQQDPGLFETGKRLSQKGVQLFQRGVYEEALDAFTKAIDKFKEAMKVSQNDRELTDAIKSNISAAKKNISACHIGIGSSISKTALEAFYSGNLESAVETFRNALTYYKTALNLSNQIEDKGAIQITQSLIDKTQTNIENCYIALDENKVEKLSNQADSLYTEALELKRQGEHYKAALKFKETKDIVDEAFDIATKRDFSDAKLVLSSILKNVRSELDNA